MTTPPGPQVRATGVVRLLDQYPELAAQVEERDRLVLRQHARAETIRLSRGEHAPTEIVARELVGALVLEGYLLRTMTFGGRRCAVLLGPDTVLRPWHGQPRFLLQPCEVSWRVLHPARLALIDHRVAAVGVRWTPIMNAFFARWNDQIQLMSMISAIYALQHIDLRLRTALWLYARAWGVTTDEGTILPVRLSHRDLSELVASQRPSVSAALADLSQRGLVQRRADRTWLLRGGPPAEISDLRVRSGEAFTLTGRPAAR